MDDDVQTAGRRRRGTLTKNPPPSVFATRYSLRKPQSTTSLQRTPSAPYPRSQVASQSARDIHQRTLSNLQASSSSSSFERYGQTITPGDSPSELFASPNKYLLLPTTSSHNDLIGAPFDSFGLLSSLNSTPANGNNNNSTITRTLPPPLTHSNTSPDLRFPQPNPSQTIPLGGQHMMEATPPKSENETNSPKRLSMDVSFSKPGPPHRKKSGFSSFVNSMLGSPRTIKISGPENPMHMIHVGYDNVTGKFTVSQIIM